MENQSFHLSYAQKLNLIRGLIPHCTTLAQWWYNFTDFSTVVNQALEAETANSHSLVLVMPVCGLVLSHKICTAMTLAVKATSINEVF